MEEKAPRLFEEQGSTPNTSQENSKPPSARYIVPLQS